MPTRRYHVRVEGLDEPLVVEILEDDGEHVRVKVGDGPERRVAISALPNRRHLVRADDRVEQVHMLPVRTGYTLLHGPWSADLTVVDERDTWLGEGGAADGAGLVTVAMPGKVVAVDVEVGQEVTRGQRLLVIEAMKMENDVKSPRDGVIKTIRVSPGAAVEAGEALIELE